MQKGCLFCNQAQVIRLFHASLATRGPVQTSLVRVDMDVYVSPTWTNGAMQM